MKQNKKIVIKFENEQKKIEEYTLEYTRSTVAMAERAGFRLDDLGSCPATQIPLLFRFAFAKNHKFLHQDKIDKIFEQLKGHSDFISKLIEVYSEPLVALFGDEEEGDEGKKAMWEASF